TPDGARAISGGMEAIFVWDLATLRCLRRFPVAGSIEFHVALTPDGRRVIAPWMDMETPQAQQSLNSNLKTLQILDLETGQRLRSFEGQGHENWINALAVDPAGRWAVTGS